MGRISRSGSPAVTTTGTVHGGSPCLPAAMIFQRVPERLPSPTET
ncbi:hypothetical protein [Nonomuraea sp. NPDC052265]